jgi:hypothetical protein
MRRLLARAALAAALTLGLAGIAQAQAPPTPPSAQAQPAQPQSQLLRLFLDCNQCDTEYLRQTVLFVDYVRDRTVADVHLLVTTQGTGGGGREWTLKFIGIGRFDGQDRTLVFTTAHDATSDDQRKEFARVFKLGIVGYAADTPAAPKLEVTFTAPEGSTPATPTRDPWNYWVFRINAGGNANGEKTSQSRSYRVSFEATRTTAEWKINLSGGRNTSRSNYEIDEAERIVSRQHSWSVNALIVKSLGPQWSFGAEAEASHSSFSNTDRLFGAFPGIEFDFFPYDESSRRSLTINYKAGVRRFDYREMTIYDQVGETVPLHSLNVSLGLRQPWGSMSGSATIAQHLNHTDRYRSSVFGATDVRLFQGFSFNFFAEYSKINDLIGLPKGAASTEEVLLRIRQFDTNYSYFFNFGISYSFGSIFNSVVNPRYGGSGGMFFGG